MLYLYKTWSLSTNFQMIRKKFLFIINAYCVVVTNIYPCLCNILLNIRIHTYVCSVQYNTYNNEAKAIAPFIIPYRFPVYMCTLKPGK